MNKRPGQPKHTAPEGADMKYTMFVLRMFVCDKAMTTTTTTSNKQGNTICK